MLKDLITHPGPVFLDEEICLINNILPEPILNSLLELAASASEEKWSQLSKSPEGQWYGSVLEFDGRLADEVRSICDGLFGGVYTFSHKMFLRRRRKSEGLLPHFDNEVQKSCTNGLVLYLNDEYTGGEIYYPNRGIEYKPVKNSLVIHTADEAYMHGVRAVQEGTRLFITLWTFKDNVESD
jgi:hypothetical protein